MPADTSKPPRSCKECRRRKLKCDRQIPCSSCVSRGKAALCPDGALVTKADRLRQDNDRLRVQVEALQSQLRSYGQTPNRMSVTSLGDDADSPDETEPSEESWAPPLGTLLFDPSGRTRYVGSSAASEWLNEVVDSGQGAETVKPNPHLPDLAQFPLRSASETHWPLLVSLLPGPERARTLLDAYQDLYSYNYDVVSRAQLEAYLGAFRQQTSMWTMETHPHRLALIFMVLAMGSLLDPDSDSQHNQESKQFFEAAEVALSIVNFLRESTIASVQTLHIMANYHLYEDRLRGGERAWPIGGLAMRIVQAMGLHRDGKTWNLPESVVEERRRLFWEIHTEETFQAHCFGRPGALFSRHFDVEYPMDSPVLPFSTTRYKLVRISSSILDEIMSIEPTSYSTILRLYQQLVTLESDQPEGIRWTPATAPMPSSQSTWAETPREDKERLCLYLKQHILALNINETFLFLMRTHFARALSDHPQDPSQSRYKEAFTAVFERCQTILDIAKSLYILHPRVAARHWFFWYHACSAAVCLASIPILAPLSPMALQGWLQLQSACTLFSSVAHQSRSTMASLALLLRLRASAFEKMSGGNPQSMADLKLEAETDESSLLMGQKTHLVERQRRHRAHLAHPSSPVMGTAHSQSPIWELPSQSIAPPAPAEASIFTFDLPPEQHADTNQSAFMNQAIDFNLDSATSAYLGSMWPGPSLPMPDQAPFNWDNLDTWLGGSGVYPSQNT